MLIQPCWGYHSQTAWHTNDSRNLIAQLALSLIDDDPFARRTQKRSSPTKVVHRYLRSLSSAMAPKNVLNQINSAPLFYSSCLQKTNEEHWMEEAAIARMLGISFGALWMVIFGLHMLSGT